MQENRFFHFRIWDTATGQNTQQEIGNCSTCHTGRIVGIPPYCNVQSWRIHCSRLFSTSQINLWHGFKLWSRTAQCYRNWKTKIDKMIRIVSSIKCTQYSPILFRSGADFSDSLNPPFSTPNSWQIFKLETEHKWFFGTKFKHCSVGIQIVNTVTNLTLIEKVKVQSLCQNAEFYSLVYLLTLKSWIISTHKFISIESCLCFRKQEWLKALLN